MPLYVTQFKDLSVLMAILKLNLG